MSALAENIQTEMPTPIVFTDSAEVNGMNKGRGRIGVKAQPADRLVCLDGEFDQLLGKLALHHLSLMLAG